MASKIEMKKTLKEMIIESAKCADLIKADEGRRVEIKKIMKLLDLQVFDADQASASITISKRKEFDIPEDVKAKFLKGEKEIESLRIIQA